MIVHYPYTSPSSRPASPMLKSDNYINKSIFDTTPLPLPYTESPPCTIDEMHLSFQILLHLHDGRLDVPDMTECRIKKRVTFAEDALLYSGNVTREEVKESWYTVDDYQEFKRDRKEAVRLLKRNGFDINMLENAGHCLRGFEPYFSLEINRAIKHARETACRNVLREQQRQYEMGVRDPEAIRASYIRASGWMRTNAMQLGLNDAAQARESYRQQIPRQHSNSSVNRFSRREFMKSASLCRQKSQRHLQVQDEAEQESRHEMGILKKLENAMQLVGKLELSEGDISQRVLKVDRPNP